MNRMLTVTLLAGLALLAGCQRQAPVPAAAAPLAGSWEFVSARYTAPGRAPQVLGQADMHALKVLTPSHFSFVSVAGDGKFYAAAGGRYQVTGDAHAGTYTETAEVGSVPGMVRKGYPFAYRIEGKLWHHEGDEDGMHIEEVWRRVD